jgi:CheY-like chemotaxis protein
MGTHAVQFYENAPVLYGAIERFVEPALRDRQPVLMLSRRHTFEAVADRLRSGHDMGLDAASRITFLDAETALPAFMNGDLPDPARLEQAFSTALDQAARGGGDGGTIWIYGELVDLLCGEGRFAAAVRIEELWNALYGARHLRVLCGYALDAFGGDANAHYFRDVCRQHTHVHCEHPAWAASAAAIDAATVYVVDDDPSMRQSIARLLASADLTVRTFASAEAFLAAVDPRSSGCLILDVQLSGMSGTKLQTRMAAERWSLPVIAMSASQNPRIGEEVVRLGAKAFLSKPFDAQVLLDAIARVLR